MTNKKRLKFSVITSVYKSDVPEYVRMALESTFNQTLVPDEVVCVADGPIPDELKAVVEEFHTKYPEIMHPLYLEKNGGLGEAMRIASLEAKYDYLARMDSDDICMPDRFEKQMRCFEEDPELSIVGGMITEFEGDPENVFAKRILPLEDTEIKKMMRGRCAVNHVTVIFKKADLMKAGNYQPFYLQEDQYLWARMMLAGCKFRNIPDIVVNVRSGRDQLARRGGWKFFKSVVRVFWFMYKNGLISFWYFLKICAIRGTVQLLMPNWLRTWVYQHFLRK